MEKGREILIIGIIESWGRDQGQGFQKR
jgi:hypothetical protein